DNKESAKKEINICTNCFMVLNIYCNSGCKINTFFLKIQIFLQFSYIRQRIMILKSTMRAIFHNHLSKAMSSQYNLIFFGGLLPSSSSSLQINEYLPLFARFSSFCPRLRALYMYENKLTKY
ncbi:MAG: hypothetical protein MJZ53_03205, partial [Paludibacteraceae bacterium]|nr:hypothetical protein [Paludibacteraceae bacterium]